MSIQQEQNVITVDLEPALPDCQCAADTAVICVQLAVDALKSLHTSAQATLWVNHLSEDLKTLRLFAEAQSGHLEA